MTDLPGWLKHGTVWLLLAAGLFLGVQAWMAQRRPPRASSSTAARWRSAAPPTATTTGRAASTAAAWNSWSTPAPPAPRSRRRWPRELGLATVGSVRSQTAGGVGDRHRGRGPTSQLQGGVSAERLRMVALPGLAAPLLGMDVLGRLRWQQGEGVLRMHLHGATR